MAAAYLFVTSAVYTVSKFKFDIDQIKNENKNTTGEDTYAGALRAPRAGSPACVFVFVFDLIYVKFEFQKKGRCEVDLSLDLTLKQP